MKMLPASLVRLIISIIFNLFSFTVVKMIVSVWKKKSDTQQEWIFNFPDKLTTFEEKYDAVQDQLGTIAGLDDLLTGNRSSSFSVEFHS